MSPRSRVGMEGTSDGGGGGGSGGTGVILEEERNQRQSERWKIDRSQSAEQQLASLRDLKNSLVGDEKAKRSALALFVVKDVLTFLDAARDGDSGGCFYQSSLLHGIGLLTILCSSALPEALAEVYLAPSGSRIVRHITRAMEMASPSTRNGGGGSSTNNSSEKLTATVLRAISSLCTCLIPPTTTRPDDGGEDRVVNKEKSETLNALKELSAVVLNEIVTALTTTTTTTAAAVTAAEVVGGGGGRGRQRWPPSLITLGLEALAAMTRVEVRSKQVTDGPTVWGAVSRGV